MSKPFQVTITFQVTEEVSVEALSADDAIRQAIERMDERTRPGRFVGADVGMNEEQR